METSHKQTAHQSAPCCLICSQPIAVVEGANHPEEASDRALICIQHPTIPSAEALTEVYYLRCNEYYLRIAEISVLVQGHSVRAAWYTTHWFSLLLELSSGDLLLIYPIMRDAAIVYVPSKFRAHDSPKGLTSLRAEGLTEVSGSCDRGMPKPGLCGVVAAIQLGLPIENIEVDGKSFGEIMEISFAGYYKLRISAEGWVDMGYEREADDLSLDWFAGREPQLIAIG